jgi:hypothetical protein
MYKKIIVGTLLVAVIGLLVFGAVNRTQARTGTDELGSGYRRGNGTGSSQSPVGSGQTGWGQGNRGVQSGSGLAGSQVEVLPPATGDGLDETEAEALRYMREEEKLAHDIYQALYQQWGVPTFSNISRSEQTHTDAILGLLVRYSLSDPASGEAGVFTNPELQALYNDLLAQGSQSLAEALKVGATIEEKDILDLQARPAQTDNADIQQVFTNLLGGSENHLRAFVTALERQTGETYQPLYLSAEAYQTILNASTGRGGSLGSPGAPVSGGYAAGSGGWRGGRGQRP